MIVAEAATLTEGLKSKNIPRRSYNRWRKQGLAYDEMYILRGRRRVRLVVFIDSDGRGHQNFVLAWVKWNEEGLGVKTWSENYRKKMLRYARHFFGKYPAISTDNARQWITEIKSDSAAGRKDRFKFVSGFAGYLHKKGLIDDSTKVGIAELYPRDNPYYKEKKYIINKAQIEKLLAFLPTAVEDEHQSKLLVAVFTLAAETGLRVSEICDLKPEELTFCTDPTSNVRPLLAFYGKGGVYREVPFSLRAQEAVQAYLEVKPKHLKEYVFWNKHIVTNKYTRLTRDWLSKRCVEYRDNDKVKFKFSCHSFRHYRASVWANSKIPLVTTKAWMGHKKISTTMGYVHTTSEEALHEAVFNGV